MKTPLGLVARRLSLLFALLAACALGVGTSASAGSGAQPRTLSLPQAFDITVLGATTDIFPYAVNDAGQVAGLSNAGLAVVRYDPGSGVHSLGLLDGYEQMSVLGINSHGDIAATAFRETRPQYAGVLYHGDGTQETLAGVARAVALNDNDQVVVATDESEAQYSGAVWQNGSVTGLGYAHDPDKSSIVNQGWSINNSGVVVGGDAYVPTGVVLYEALRWPTPAATPDILAAGDPGLPYTAALLINNPGQMLVRRLGPVVNHTEYFNYYLRQPGGSETKIGTGGFFDIAGTIPVDYALNDSGQVLISLSDPPLGQVLWQNGQTVKVLDLVPATSGYTLRFVTAMNNLGQLVGQVQRADGAFLSVLLTPRAPDTTNPVVSVNSPADGARLRSPVPIKADITDASSVLWTVSFPNDFDSMPVRGTTKGPGAIDLNIALPTGAHLVRIDVVDSSGNRTTIDRNITVGEPGATLKSFDFKPTTAAGGKRIPGFLELTGPAPSGGARVTFTSSKPSVKPPAAVRIPAGAARPKKPFKYRLPRVKQTTSFDVTAAYGGVSLTVTLTATAKGH